MSKEVEINHSERGHSALGPSASAKWLACSASLQAEATFLELNPGYDDSNPAAEEGTRAHELGDKFLQNPDLVNESHDDVPVEMLRNTLRYVDYCLSIGSDDPDAVRATEQQLYMPRIHEDAYGTGDYNVYTPSNKTLHVIDYKYGQGIFVSCKENSQMLMYGEGAREYLLKEHGEIPEKYVLHVYQPRMDNIDSWEIDAAQLEEFVVFAAKRAKLTRTIPAVFTPGEKQCRWCLAKPICEAYTDFCLNIARDAFSDLGDEDADLTPGLLKDGIMTDERIGELLSDWDNLNKMGKALKAYVQARLMQNKPVPGYKLVGGKSSYKPDEGALEFILDDEAFSDPKVLSKTALKTKIGAKAFAPLERYYIESKGSPTLAKTEDRRKEWSPDDYTDEFEDLPST